MTFKLTREEQSDARRVLTFARETLPGRWCGGADARQKDGLETTPGSPQCAQFCLVGALRRGSRSYQCNVLPALDTLHVALCDRYPWNREVRAEQSNDKADLLREWNDGTARSTGEVLSLIDHALVLLR